MFTFFCVAVVVGIIGFVFGTAIIEEHSIKLRETNKLLEEENKKLIDHVLYLEGGENLCGAKLLPAPKEVNRNPIEELMDKIKCSPILNIYGRTYYNHIRLKGGVCLFISIEHKDEALIGITEDISNTLYLTKEQKKQVFDIGTRRMVEYALEKVNSK